MPSLKSDQLTGSAYWHSLDELADTPEFRQFVAREFPNRASEWLDGNRRHFLKIMAASFALAGLAGCRRWPEEQLAPYAHRPANRDPGTPIHYNTGMELGGYGQGMRITSVDGRPIKVDGNPDHPFNKGGSDIYGQASVLNVYDPDRSRSVLKKPAAGEAVVSTWAEFAAFWRSHASGLADGQGVMVLSGASSSPSVADMKARLLKAWPQAKWFEYEAVSYDNARSGAMLAFGRPLRVMPRLDRAAVVLSLDFDFLVGSPCSVKLARDFVAGRRLTDPTTGALAQSMNRLYVIEAGNSTTGSYSENVEHRMPVAAQDVLASLCQIALELTQQGLSLEASIPSPKLAPLDAAKAAAIAADLLANKGRSVVVVGNRQPAQVHALAAAINTALQANGRTVEYFEDPEPQRPHHYAAISQAASLLHSGKVSTVIVLGGNPAYNAPADLQFDQAIAKAATTIHYGDYADETAKLCTWHLPASHYLENWGDVRSADGLVGIVQPLIEPIFGGKSVIEVLAMLTGDTVSSGYEIVQRTLGMASTGWKWKKSLFDGYVEGTAWSPVVPTLTGGPVASAASALLETFEKNTLSVHNLEIVFQQDTRLYDGRFANNGWLQELPDPMTRMTWDNPALVSPKTAAALGLDPYKTKLVKLHIGGRELTIAPYVLPGQPEFTVTLLLGYGRTQAGNVGNGVGFNTYSLRTTEAMDFESGATLAATDEDYRLASVQNHHIMSAPSLEAIGDRAPKLIQQATFAELLANPSLKHEKRVVVPLYEAHHYNTGYQWGMSVDLTSCIGCSACVVACQAENNIPIVGKHQVLMGREMQWIRIDRYFRGTSAHQPESVHQPVMCMQCETAPCEAVCPVGATSTSADGINMMAYNRCIGTRYCANNCPYKVRRFNYLDWNSGTLKDQYQVNLLRAPMNDLTAMQKNPQVSIRMRGVMEKCTYCVQRIETARVVAERQGNRRIRDGEVTPACAQACPTQALVFGDIRDKASRVAVLQDQARSYGLLNDILGTVPRTRYLPRISNPNPAMGAAEYTGLGSE